MMMTWKTIPALFLLILLFGCTESADVYQTSPHAGARNVAADTTVTVNFSHAMDAETVTADTFMVYGKYYQGYYPGDITGDEEGISFTFTLSDRGDGESTFLSGEEVTVTLTDTIIGTDNIPYEGMTFTFHVAGDVPEMYLGPIEVVSVTPADGTGNVPSGTPVTIQFSRSVNIASLEDGISVFGSWTGFRNGSVSGASSTATLGDVCVFVPDTPFLPGETIEIFMGDAIYGEESEDYLAPFGVTFNQAAGSVVKPWLPVEMVRGVGAQAIALGDVKASAAGLEGMILDDNGTVYLVTPSDSTLPISHPFTVTDATLMAVRAGDLMEDGASRMMAASQTQSATQILFIEPEGYAGLAEYQDRLEIDGRYGRVILPGHFDGDAYVDVILGGADGLALIGREVPESEEDTSGGIPDISDLLNMSEEELANFGQGGGRQEASFVRLEQVFPALTDVSEVVSADINGDGRLDLVVRHDGRLSCLLWEGARFSEAAALCDMGARDGFALARMDGDNHPDVCVVTAGANPAVRIFRGGDNGFDAQEDGALALPSALTGTIRILPCHLAGRDRPELLVAAGDWSDIMVLTPQEAGDALDFSLDTIPFSGAEALACADIDGNGLPELFVSDSDSMWRLSPTDGIQPPSLAELYLRPEKVVYVDDNTAQVTVSGISDMSFDQVRIALSFDPDQLVLDSVTHPAVGYFNSNNTSYETCNAANGCTDRVMVTMQTSKSFDIHAEVDLVTLTFSFIDPTGGESPVQLENGLLDGSGSVMDNAFHSVSPDTWILAGLTLPQVVLQYEGTILEVSCAQGDDGQQADISWSSPSGHALDDVRVYRNGLLQHSTSGAGTWTDQAMLTGTNLYEVFVYEGTSLVARDSCQLVYVAAPEITFCDVSGGDLVVRWDAVGNVNGYYVWRDDESTPVQTLYGNNTLSYSEADNSDGAGHLFAVSAFIGSVVSERTWCESVIGGNQANIELPSSFSAAPAGDDSFAVNLTWSQGEGYEAIVVLRNGEEIDRIGLQTQFQDTQVVPGLYTYQLRAVARDVLQAPVTAPPVEVEVPLCTGLICALTEDGQVAMQWHNPANAHEHFNYDAVVLQRTLITPEGTEQALETREIAHDAQAYVDTVSQGAGQYRYTLRVQYDGNLYPIVSEETCTVEFVTQVYPLAVTAGAGLQDIELPIQANLTGVAEEVRFTYHYAGGGGRLDVTGFVPGPGLTVTMSEPETDDGLWYRTDVVVEGPVNAGSEIQLCSFLATTASDFSLYGYDQEPKDEEKARVSVGITDIRVTYPGDDLVALDPVDETVSVTCRYLLASTVEGLGMGDTFSMPIFGTFDQSLLGYTLSFSYDPEVLECLSETIEDTDTPDGLFFASDHDNDNGVAYIAWIASFEPVDPVTPGLHRLMAYLQFRVVGPAKAGKEVLIQEITFNGQSHAPLLTPSGWYMGDYLEHTYGADIVVDAAPVIQTLSPLSGPLAGGNRLEIRGTNFGYDTPVVTVQGRQAAVVQNDNEYILCTVPGLSYATLPTEPVAAVVSVQNGIGIATAPVQYEYLPLSLTGVDPTSGPVTGGDQVRIAGDGIDQTARVFFGAEEATVTLVDQVGGTYLLAEAPSADALGAVTVRVTLDNGQSETIGAGYTYVAAAPQITGVAPDHGPLSGGTSVVISGDGFLNVASVYFGAVAAESFVVVSPQRIDAVSPAGEGSVMITVNTSAGSAQSPFLYQGAELTVSGFSPDRGTFNGGTEVVVTGSGFQLDTQVFFDGIAASVSYISDTALAVTTPAGAGQVLVTVGQPGGDPVVAAQAFTYESEAADIASFTPQTGPQAGGNTVTLTGSHFIPETQVGVDGAWLAEVSYVSATQLTVVMPSGSGAVPITVQNPGTAIATASMDYTYESTALFVTGLIPDKGSRFGGTTIQIQGEGFFGQTQVFFGDNRVPAAQVSMLTDNLLQVVTPAHVPGAAPVYVKNPETDEVASPDDFTFEAFTVTDMTPDEASICGSAEVSIYGSSFNEGITVRFGTDLAETVTVVSEYELLVTTPQVPEGTDTVQVALSYEGSTLTGPVFTFQGILFIRGDTNGDGDVTITDAYLLRDFVHGLKDLGAPQDAADVDDNGVINIADVDYLFRYLMSSGAPPAAPFPAPGTDPTLDSLDGCTGF